MYIQTKNPHIKNKKSRIKYGGRSTKLNSRLKPSFFMCMRALTYMSKNIYIYLQEKKIIQLLITPFLKEISSHSPKYVV